MAGSAASSSHTRVEYLGFRNVDDAREYTYTVHSSAGACRFLFLVPLEAFARSGVLIQDGPDVCYQQLVRELAEGDNVDAAPRAVGERHLREYREAHTPGARTRARRAPGGAS